MTDATELDIDAIRARVEAATEGPWDVVPMRNHPGVWDVWGVRPDEVIGDGEVHVAEVRGYEADAEFIAHARTDLPAALDEITQLRTALTEAIDELVECRSFISVETRHYPTVLGINEVVERIRPLATPPTTERSK